MLSKRFRRVLIGVGAVVALTAGTAVGVGAVASDANGGPGAAPAPRAGAASPTESAFVPIVPCRIFSSVPTAAGKFTPGQTRSIDKGGNLSGQGGNAAGCGIPSSATALEVNITAALAEGNGYIRVWPDESVEQPATFMNFTNHFNVSNAGTVDVDKGNQDVMDLKVYGSRTHVIIDVMGYYVEELFALVSADGTLVRGNGVVSSQQLSTGQYEIIFDRNISGCAYDATLNNMTDTGEVVTDLRLGTNNGVFVQTHSSAGGDVAKMFFLTLDC